MKCEYFRTPSLSNKRSFYAVLRSVLWRRWYIKLSNFVYFQAATKSRRFSVTHRQLWFVQVVQLCYVSQLVARHDSQRVSLSYILLKHMIWLKVKCTISLLGPIYSRSEYCTQYSIWCTDWPNYNVWSQQTGWLTVHDNCLGTQIWTISLFQIPSRAITDQNLCRKSLFYCYLLSQLTVRVVREILIRNEVNI